MPGSAFGLRHRTSKRYLIVMPGQTDTAKYTAYVETPNEADASTWDREGVEQAHMALGSFAGAWKVCELDRPLSPTGEPE